MKIRVKCYNCNTVQDVYQDCPCCKCQAPLVATGQCAIQMYRMGSPIGVAVGYGIYIDGEPMGHLANKESVYIPVTPGFHNIHVTCGATRHCQDLQVTIEPGNIAYVKARIKPGFWRNTIIVEPATPESMPPA
ncbi:MAG: DUF2846 domain-containing protein [Lachnospiraceae bacterium]|nr:DUF2846 domain-containing protein [Lachnospiraceae bacterium]